MPAFFAAPRLAAALDVDHADFTDHLRIVTRETHVCSRVHMEPGGRAGFSLVRIAGDIVQGFLVGKERCHHMRLENNQQFPTIVARRVGGGQMTIPADLAGSWSVALFYRGEW